MRTRRVTLALLLSVTVLVGVVAATLAANRVPLLATPGPAERLTLYLTRNVAEMSPDSRFPELRSPRYRLPATEIATAVAAAASAAGFEQVTLDASGRRVSAVAVSRLFGFVDDLEVSVQEEDGVGTVLARSASRVGRADFGANQHHLRRLRRALDERLASSALPR